MPTRFAEQLAYMEAHPDVALLGTGLQVFNEGDDRPRAKKPKNPNPTFDDLLRHNSIIGATVMIRRVGGTRRL